MRKRSLPELPATGPEDQPSAESRCPPADRVVGAYPNRRAPRTLEQLQACAPETVFSSAEAETYLNKTAGTMKRWWQARVGPRPLKQVHFRDYMKCDLDAWLESCRRETGN